MRKIPEYWPEVLGSFFGTLLGVAVVYSAIYWTFTGEWPIVLR